MPAVLMMLLFVLVFLVLAVALLLAPFLGVGFALWKRHKLDEANRQQLDPVARQSLS
jgi:hypothetical protein